MYLGQYPAVICAFEAMHLLVRFWEKKKDTYVIYRFGGDSSYTLQLNTEILMYPVFVLKPLSIHEC